VLGSGIAQYGPQIADAFGQIVTAIVPLIPQILELIPPILLLATQVIPPLASVLGMILPPIIQGLSFLLTSVLAPALNFIVNGLSGAATAAGAFFGLLAGNTSLQGFLAQIQGIAGPFGDMERWLLKTEQDFVNWGASILRAVADGVRGVVSFVTGLPGQIAAAAAGAGKWLVDAGANLIQGLIKGIQGAVGGVLSFVKSIGNNIADAFKSALGIHSPSTVFQGFGVNILRGLEAGLAAPNTIGALVGSLSSRVADGFGSPLNSRARSVIAGSYSGSGGNISGAAAAVPPVTVQAYMLPEQDPRIVGRQFGREFARAIAGAPA
jgi:hypothetical protein